MWVEHIKHLVAIDPGGGRGGRWTSWRPVEVVEADGGRGGNESQTPQQDHSELDIRTFARLNHLATRPFDAT